MKKFLSAALAGGLILGMGAGVANAASTILPTETEGDLTIHKYEQPVITGNDNSGLELPASELENLVGLEDVEFKVSKIDVDLSTNAGWTEFSGVATDFDPADPVTSITPPGLDDSFTPRTGVTDENGVYKFEGLPIGAYLVQETDAPDGVTMGLPFLVTIPVTNPATDSWVYDVHAYPKNVVSSVLKESEDVDAYELGDDVVFTIIGSIPGGDVTDYYVITDQLDSKLDIAATGAATVKAGNTTLTSPAQFGYTVSDTNLVTITLTEAGREAIYDELKVNPDAKVVATLTTQVNASGVIENQAILFPNSSSVDTGGIPSNKVETKWGGIEVLKFDADDDAKAALAGAKFEVYGAKDPLTADGVLPTGATKLTNLPGMDAQGQLTTADGKLTVDGLRYSDFANDESITTTDDDQYNYYFLVEVVAPEGFNLLANPIQFTVTSQAVDSVTVEVANSSVIDYPGSGANGTMWIVIAGVAALAVAGGILVVNRKKVSVN